MPEYFGGMARRGSPGALIDSGVILRDLLILISLMFADRHVAHFDPRVRSLWSDHLEAEVLQRLAATAAILRAKDDWLLEQAERLALSEPVRQFRASPCGTLQPDMRAPEEVELNLREACNKIIHATRVAYDVEGNDPETSYITPIIYLYGSKGAVEWRAVLDLQKYVQLGAHSTDFM